MPNDDKGVANYDQSADRIEGPGDRKGENAESKGKERLDFVSQITLRLSTDP